MMIKNTWWVGAFTGEIRSRPLARSITGEPVVFFRGSDGHISALEDRCCHRGLPLSMGEIDGDRLRCQYHGLEFDRLGVCVKIPSQDVIPVRAKVRTYPIAVRGQAVWIWMGNSELADESLIPEFPWFDDPSWDWKFGVFNIKCNYQLLQDNLLDLSHAAYVHASTIGGTPDEHFSAPTKVERTDRGVKVTRHFPNSVPAATHAKLAHFDGRVDRWQEFEWSPGFISLDGGSVDVSTGAFEGRREGGVHLRLFNGITPESDRSTFNLFAAGQNFRPGEPDVTQTMFDEFERTIMEDVTILEALQLRTDQTEGKPFIDIRSDAAGNQARRMLDRMQQKELLDRK